VEADGFQHTSPLEVECQSPCFRGRSPQPPLGHPGHGFPHPHPQAKPGPLVLPPPPGAPRVPSFPADPPSPSPAFPLKPGFRLTEGGGTGLPPKQRRGPSPKNEVGGPPRLPTAGFSLWTLLPPASGRSSEPRPETSGRWEGAGPPRSREGGRKNLPQPPPGSGQDRRGSGVLGAPRPQVTRALGGRDDAGPVPERNPKSEGCEGAGIPSAHARHPPGSAPFKIRSVQSRSEGGRAPLGSALP
jgi:hypothetical protein